MKAVIAVPPILDFYFTPSRASALGAAAVEEICSRRGIETVFLNFPMLGKKPVRQDLPEELSHLAGFLMPEESGPLSFFTGYKRFGPSPADSALQILLQNPDIVFLSVFAWAYAEEAVQLASQLKRLKPEIPIVAGGAGVSVNPAYFINCDCIDSVLPGEAETILNQFLDYSDGEFIGMNRDLFSLDDNPGFYIRETGYSASKKIRYYSAVLSRGCPKSCRFCSNRLVHGKKFRKASLREIAAKVDRLPDDCNVHLNFEDDNLLFDREFFFSVMGIVRNRFPGAVFTAENGLDYTLLDGHLVSMLTKSGFKSFNFSMASADQGVLTKEKRGSDPGRLKEVLLEAAASGAGSTTYFICGLEGDSIESTVDNLVTLHKLPTLTGISMFYPVPGLHGFEPEKMSSFHPRLCAGSSAWPWTGSLTTAEMITAFRLARFSNLVKTFYGTIPNDARGFSSATAGKLIKQIIAARSLYTLIGNELCEVPNLSKALISEFIDRAGLS